MGGRYTENRINKINKHAYAKSKSWMERIKIGKGGNQEARGRETMGCLEE